MNQETKQIFSIRKFKTGTHSALLAKYGIVLAVATVLMGAATVSADEWVANSPDMIQISSEATSYKLKYGDTLWAVSQKLGLPVDVLAAVSGVNLSAGEQYRLPVGFTVSWNMKTDSVSLTDEQGQVQNTVKVDEEGHLIMSSVDSAAVKEVPISSIEKKDGVTIVHLNTKESVSKNVNQTVQVDSKKVESKEVESIENDKVSNSKVDETIKQKEDKKQFDGDDKITLIKPNSKYSSNFVLVESNGHYGLVDAGVQPGNEKEEFERVTSYLDKVGVKTLDFIFVSHWDVDHYSTLSGIEELGNYKGTLFDKYEVKEMIFKPLDIQEFKTFEGPVKRDWQYYEKMQKGYNDVVATLTSKNIPYSLKDSFKMGDFDFNVVNKAAAKDDEKQNFWMNLESLGLLVTKTGSDGDKYNMFLAGDLEGYDVPETIQELKELGVNQLDGYELAHHGWSFDQKERYMLSDELGVPITGVTNAKGNLESSSKGKKMAEDIEGTFTRGLYWQGDGSVQFDYSDTENKGLVVRQEGNPISWSVKHENGDSVFTKQDVTPPTQDDLTRDQLKSQTEEDNSVIQNNEKLQKEKDLEK